MVIFARNGKAGSLECDGDICFEMESFWNENNLNEMVLFKFSFMRSIIDLPVLLIIRSILDLDDASH